MPTATEQVDKTPFRRRWHLAGGLLLIVLAVSCVGRTASVGARSSALAGNVKEVCWYPRAATGKPSFFITARVRQAKKVIFFYHKRPQRGLHQGHSFSTNYAVSWSSYKRAMHQPSNVPGIGKVSLHVTLRSNRRFVYTSEPWTCTLGALRR